MRYEDRKEVKKESGEPGEPYTYTEQNRNRSAALETMKQPEDTEDTVVDRFQAAVYDAGRRALDMLDSRHLTNAVNRSDVDRAGDALRELGKFHYNIGFAGPQSCGKSSLINAIIRYPLMPTCNLATTCTPVEVIYGREIQIQVKDEDLSGKIVFHMKCAAIPESDFNLLKRYACSVMSIAIIENLQLFSDVYIAEDTRRLKDHIHMDCGDPRQTAMLMLILFTVYAHQNNKELNAEEERLNALRLETLAHFGIRSSTVNYRVVIQWDNPMLASGLKITDLPGLGSSAEDKEIDGKLVKGHDTITKEAVLRTDTMAFMSEPMVLADAVPALETMASNASLLDAVSVNDRIVPIMNKVDMLVGVQKKTTTINMMLAMMQNAGVNMDGKKVWEITSLYGEYAYESFDLARTYFVQTEVFHLIGKGYTEDEIQNKLPGILDDLKRGYERSGIDQLRKFFRTAFIGKGKYLKTFSAVVALRKLALDSIPGLRGKIDSINVLADVNRDLAGTALANLEEAAVTPMNDAQRAIGAEVSRLAREDDSSGIIDSLIRDATAQYISIFEEAAVDYRNRLLEISQKFHLTWGGFGNRARVDSGNSYNQALYEELQEESGRLHVDVKQVNKIHAAALQHCKNGIDQIYQDARNRLVDFQREYPQVVGACVDRYREKAAPEVLALMDSLTPAVLGFVDAKIKTADASIQRQTDEFQNATDRLAQSLLARNDSFVATLLKMVQEKLNTVSGGWFTKKEFLDIDGVNGLADAIKNLPLTEADKEAVRDDISMVALEQIKRPMLGWYKEAGNEVNVIMGNLSREMVLQFRQIREDLQKNIDDKNSEKEKNIQTLNALCRIFAELREEIQSYIDQALGLGISADNSAMKGDFFEGILEQEADAGEEQ